MQKVRGINFAPFAPRGTLSTKAAQASLTQMCKDTNANTIILCPSAVQANPFTDQIHFEGPHTLSDNELLIFTDLAHSLGLRVFWKPTVNCLDGTWRAHINFFDHDVPCEAKWSNWFRDYEAFQLHFAALAQQAGVELFILGCEMTQTERREAEWRHLIAEVRRVYSGAISYNCDKYGEEYVAWWDAVDVISSSGYYPIDQMETNLDRIENVVHKFQKPFFFAEAGCMRVHGSSFVPNNWELQGVRDDDEQTKWLQSLFSACESRPWIGGMALWDWSVEDDLISNRYSFRTKASLNCIRSAYLPSRPFDDLL